MGRSTDIGLHRCIYIIITTAILLIVPVLSVPVNAQGTVRHTFNEGINLISIPFDYAIDEDTEFGDPILVFGMASVPDRSSFDLLAWLVGSYYSYYDPPEQSLPAREIKAGRGYFLFSQEAPIPVYASAMVVEREIIKPDPYAIDLYAGWNLIGCPYHEGDKTYSIRWYGDEIMVQVGAGEPMFVRDATSAGIIKPGLWTYIGGRYEFAYTLDEWRGYWVKATRNCRLLIRRQNVAQSRAAGDAFETRQSDELWSHDLVVTAAPSLQDSVRIGQCRGASDGYDMFLDIEKPPAVTVAPYVYASILHRDWQNASGAYAADMRSPGGRSAWNLMVQSNVTDRDIMVTWPDLGRLPKDVNLTLVDEELGTTRCMRTTSGYRFRLSPGVSQRRFRVEAAPAAAGMLRITGLMAGNGRGMSRTLTCNLSSDASVDVVIKPASGGRAVRRIAEGVTRSAGLNQFVWDCRDDGGNPVPAGLYLCEVRATGNDGQVVKAAAVLMVAR